MDGFKSLKELFQKGAVGRRTFLKMIGVVGVTAAAAGCTKNESDEYDSILTYSDDLVLDNGVKRYYSTGPHNCGTRCKHNLFVKNGRVIKMTSDGDIPREGCRELDESVADAQKRACVRGYAYIKRQYQPDRLKYPLLQTKERGDITGFKRISWSDAIDRLTKMMQEMKERKDTLKYLPIRVFWNIPNILKKHNAERNPTGLGPCISIYGNASFGNIASALWDAAGYDSAYNSSVDMLNSGLLLSWAVDVTSSFGHQGPSYWYYTKAKEAGVPIVLIEAKYSDTAASIATGTTLTYNKNGKNINNFEIPPVVIVRPGTDCALAAAMCYVIWKNKEYDEQFLRDKCFGFFAGQTVTNESKDETQEPGFVGTVGTTASLAATVKHSVSNYFNPTAYVKAAEDATGNSQSPILGQPYAGFFSTPWKGKSFTVPEGKSFEEYMQVFEAEHGGYDGVLSWAAKVTGANAQVIEALALKYATTKPARLDGGGGPQRTFDGMYYSWFTIALAAMTGNSDKQGGGPGYSMMNEAGAYTFHGAYMVGSGNRLDPFASVLISIDNWADVILTGKDERTRAQVIEDLLIFNGINLKDKLLTNDKLIEIDMMISCANHLVTMPNVNKNIYAVTKRKDSNPLEYEVKYNVTVDHFMTSTAVYSDLVLPCTTHWEEVDGIGLYTLGDLFLKQQAIEPMFEAKSDAQIWYEVGEKMKLPGNKAPISGVGNPINDYVASTTYDVFPLHPFYNKVVDSAAVKPPFAAIKENGRVNMPVPQDKAVVGMRDISPIGSLSTTTGRINFYSPFYGEIRPGRTLASGPRYLDKMDNVKYPFYDGYEKMLDASGSLVGWTSPLSNRKYKLQVLTDKAKNRAHTAFDNVAMLKDKFPQTCKINPQDAGERGIADGQLVYVYNDRGCLKIPAEVTDTALPGVIRVQHGGWYRAATDPKETVKIWLNVDKNKENGTKELVVPVDVGGCENILTLDKQTGANDPFIGGSIYAQGNLCEVSLTKPE